MGLCLFLQIMALVIYTTCVITMNAISSDDSSSDLQNSTLITANAIADIGISSNESNNLQVQIAILNGSYSSLQSHVESIEHDIRTVKSIVLQLYTETAALKLVGKECAYCQNETALLRRDVQNLNRIITELQEREKAREDDFIALYNKLTSGEESMSSIQVNITNLTSLLNTTLISNGKIVSEMEKVFQRILHINETNNANIQTIKMTIGELEQKTRIIESNWSKELHQISTECKSGISKLDADLQNESIIRESIFNLSSQSLHDFAVTMSSLERNLTESVGKLSETCKHNISKDQTDRGGSNTYASFSNITNYLKQLETEFLELKLNLTDALDDASLRSLENITMMETGLKNEVNALNMHFNTSLIGLHSDMDRIRSQTTFLGSSLTSALHAISTTNSMNIQNISSMLQEFTTNLETLKRQQNIIITNITRKFYELQDETRTIIQNQTQAADKMSMLIAQNLTRIGVDYKDEVQKFSTFYNTSLEKMELRINNFNGQFQIFEQDLLKAVHEILKQHDNNISNVDKEIITIVKTMQISQNSSMEALLKEFIEFEGKSTFIAGNLSAAISNIATECYNNISSVKSGFKNEVSRVVTTQNTINESISNELSDLYFKFSILTRNLLETTNQIGTITERVALTACSNTAALTGGMVIPFVNIKFSDGIPNLRNFQLTGKFTSEKSGLYLIAAHVMSYSKGAAYTIMKNSEELSRVQITPYHDDDAHNYHTGTGVAVVELVPYDEVWIKVQNVISVMNIFGAESCLTMTKIK